MNTKISTRSQDLLLFHVLFKLLHRKWNSLNISLRNPCLIFHDVYVHKLLQDSLCRLQKLWSKTNLFMNSTVHKLYGVSSHLPALPPWPARQTWFPTTLLHGPSSQASTSQFFFLTSMLVHTPSQENKAMLYFPRENRIFYLGNRYLMIMFQESEVLNFSPTSNNWLGMISLLHLSSLSNRYLLHSMWVSKPGLTSNAKCWFVNTLKKMNW